MVRKTISLLALALVCSTLSAVADEVSIQDGEYVVKNGMLYKKTPELKPPIVTSNALPGSVTIDTKLLGETIATTTLINKRRLERAARKDAKEQWLKDHPRFATLQKYSGFLWADNHLITPYSDWVEDRQGLATGLNTTANLVNMGLLAGGAAR